MKKLLTALATAAIALAGLVVAAPQADAAVDIYVTPGYHTVGGREWRTTCAAYSAQITRCRTEIMATQVTYTNGRYVQTNGWVFNNLTYKASPRALWVNNPLGKMGDWTDSTGREWSTECDSPSTGYNNCRTYAMTSYITRTATGYGWVKGWVLNNMVRFSTDSYLTVSGTGDTVVNLPTGADQVLVYGSHSGAGAFSVETLDASNQNVDWLIDEVGAVSRMGWTYQPEVTKLQVTADGAWTIVVKPISAAPRIGTSGNGTGNSFLWYYGEARTATLTHTGQYFFYVAQESFEDSRVLVDADGPYSGQVAMLRGPSYIEIYADGAWTIN